MTLQLKKATRKQVKIKAGLQGPAGSGKTLSALIAAYGITKDWSKIAFIDTENKSASLYADRYFDTIDFYVGEFQTVELDPPFTPERCIEAMKVCNIDSIEVVIFDSISHEWNGRGGILDIHEQMGRMNDMQKWAKLTPRHNLFVDEILRFPKHMFLCMRSKQDYVMKEGTNASGRTIVIPEKVGLKAVTKEGVDYEFTLNFELDMNNFAFISKDRTGLFKGKPEFKITTETGEKILEWCNKGIQIADDVMPITKPVLNDKLWQDLLKRAESEKDIVTKAQQHFTLNLAQITQLQDAYSEPAGS